VIQHKITSANAADTDSYSFYLGSGWSSEGSRTFWQKHFGPSGQNLGQASAFPIAFTSKLVYASMRSFRSTAA